MIRVELRRPVEHDGRRIEVVEYDLDAVTADDVLSALERGSREAGTDASPGVVGLRAAQALAARLAGVHYDALGRLHPADYGAIVRPLDEAFAPFLA